MKTLISGLEITIEQKGFSFIAHAEWGTEKITAESTIAYMAVGSVMHELKKKIAEKLNAEDLNGSRED